MLVRILFCVFVFCISLKGYALREPRSTSGDSRLKVIAYSPNVVFKYIGYYGYQGNIELQEDEEVVTISMGDTTGWQIVPSGHRIFLKPIDQEATTNMTLITSKRMYFFELHAEKATNIDDPGLAFTVKFLYPDSEQRNIANDNPSFSLTPNLLNLQNYNFKYSLSGSYVISPLKIFDDGRFTYFEFRDKNAPVPAFFSVDDDGNESIVNYQVSGDYIVVERVEARFTLRQGKEIACVFNESKKYPGLRS
jgi:type IV secretion system protein VirB9